MAQLTLDLSQETLDALNEIAVAAKEQGFATQDAKGMLEYRLAREAKSHRDSQAIETFRLTLGV